MAIAAILTGTDYFMFKKGESAGCKRVFIYKIGPVFSMLPKEVQDELNSRIDQYCAEALK